MTKEEMREWISGKKKVYLCGTVRYRDAFNSQCFTNFYLLAEALRLPIWHNTNRHKESD